MTLTFRVPPRCDGWPLRDFLRVCGVSAALARQIKRAGGFFAGGAPVHTDARLGAGTAVSFALPPEPAGSVAPQDLPLTIVYEDAHAMVLDKPAGMAVHPTLGYADGTLANAFCGEMCRRGTPAPLRPVNRIDRNTSGLVLCARNAYAAPLLAAGVHKRYLAVVQGLPAPAAGVIDAPVGLCNGSIIRRCVRADGKPSRTQYRTLAAGDGLALLEAVPLTGRTHQLRVHFASIGCPLAGDDLYGGSTRYLARHALHCAAMRFVVPDGLSGGEPPAVLPETTVQSPLPADMRALCERMQPL